MLTSVGEKIALKHRKDQIKCLILWLLNRLICVDFSFFSSNKEFRLVAKLRVQRGAAWSLHVLPASALQVLQLPPRLGYSHASGAAVRKIKSGWTFKKLMVTLQLGAMAPLSWWAGESDARARLRENAGGMARKALCLLWDCEASMQIGCENDWPAKRSRGDSKMCQHLCFSYGKYVSVLFIYSQKFRWCLGKFDKHKKLNLRP